LPAGFDHAAWRLKHASFAAENVPKWAAAVRERFGGDRTKYACVGYCFGAPYLCHMLASEHVSAGAFAHPSSLKEEHLTSIKRASTSQHLPLSPLAAPSVITYVPAHRGPEPLLLSCADNDKAFNTECRRKAIDILERDNKVYHEQLFYGVSHGFAVKGDPSDPYQRTSRFSCPRTCGAISDGVHSQAGARNRVFRL
jgi:dienelactone hydrolase